MWLQVSLQSCFNLFVMFQTSRNPLDKRNPFHHFPYIFLGEEHGLVRDKFWQEMSYSWTQFIIFLWCQNCWRHKETLTLSSLNWPYSTSYWKMAVRTEQEVYVHMDINGCHEFANIRLTQFYIFHGWCYSRVETDALLPLWRSNPLQFFI